MISSKKFKANGSNKIFSIEFEIKSESHCRVYLNNILQQVEDYDIINNSIIFLEAPLASSEIFVQVTTTVDDFRATDFSTITSINVNTIGILKDTPITHNSVNILGYYVLGDGVVSNYYWDEASTATDDGGSVIKHNDYDTGRWILQVNGVINAKQFGAKGDGTTDDTTSLQNALAYSGAIRKKLLVPSGLYIVSDTLEIPLYGIVEGESKSYGTIFRFKGDGTKVVRTQVKHPDDGIDDPLAVAVLMNNPQSSMKDIYIDNWVDMNDTNPTNFGDDWDVGILIQNNDVLLEDVRVGRYFRDSGIRVDNTVDYGRCDYVKFTNVRSGGRWGLKLIGPDLKIGTTEIDNTIDKRGAGGISDFMALNCHFESMEHHSNKRYLSEDGGCIYISGAVDPGNSATNAIQGHRFYGCRGATWYPYMLKIEKSSRDLFNGCIFDRKVGQVVILGDTSERNVATGDVQVYSKPTTDVGGGTNNLKLFGVDMNRVTDNFYRGGGFYTEQQLNENFTQTTSRAEGIHEYPDGIKLGEAISNTPFDYYNQDNFNPALNFGTGITYNSQTGAWTRIGNMTFVEWEIDVATLDNTTDVSAIHIGSLPFAIAKQGSVIGNIDLSRSTLLTTTNESFQFSTNVQGSNQVFLVKQDGTTLKYNDSIVGTSGKLVINLTYRAWV